MRDEKKWVNHWPDEIQVLALSMINHPADVLWLQEWGYARKNGPWSLCIRYMVEGRRMAWKITDKNLFCKQTCFWILIIQCIVVIYRINIRSTMVRFTLSNWTGSIWLNMLRNFFPPVGPSKRYWRTENYKHLNLHHQSTDDTARPQIIHGGRMHQQVERQSNFNLHIKIKNCWVQLRQQILLRAQNDQC